MNLIKEIKMSEVNTEADNVNTGLSLADIAGISVDEVQEVRFEDLPAFRGIFKIVDAVWNDDVGKKSYLTCRLTAEVNEAGEFNDEVGTSLERQEKMVGRKHGETFFIDPADVLQGVGRIKAFLVDCGIEIQEGERVDALIERVKTEQQPFVADVKKRAKKDSEGEFFTNLHPVRDQNLAQEGESA